MQFCTYAAATMALFAASVTCAPAVDAQTDTLQERQQNYWPVVTWWAEPDFKPETQYNQQGEAKGRQGLGDCYDMGGLSDIARSAKAPDGYKCTLYSDAGCHGRRTKEFGSGGISNIGGKMAGNAAAWRCCEIGSTNYWGYCDGDKMNAGTD